MFLIRAFPNITDDFLVAYRFAEILAKRWRVGACFTTSDLMFPAIHEDDMDIFSGNMPIDSISLWFGPSQNYFLGNYKNYAFLTTLRSGQKPSIVYQMNKFWELGKDFPYPFYPEESRDKKGIFCYAPPMYNRMLEETIKAWMLSSADEPLKILAPFCGIASLEKTVSDIKKEIGCQKKLLISSPFATCPNDIKKEILSSKAIVDFRKHDSISFSSIVAQSNGIPTLSTYCTFPRSDIALHSVKSHICSDGSRLSGETIHIYDLDEMIDGFNKILDTQGQNKDSIKSIMSISRDMIMGE